MPFPSQEPPAFFKATNEDLKDIDVLCTFKIRQPQFGSCVPKTIGPIKIKMKMPHPGQDPPASSEAQNQEFKDLDVLGTFKIKRESKNLEHGSTKDQ